MAQIVVSTILILLNVMTTVLPMVRSDFIYPNADGGELNSTTAVPLYAIFNWNYHFNQTNVALVDLQYDQSIWNWCDLTMYTKEGIRPLLELSNVDIDAVNNGSLKWIANYATGVQTTNCDPPVPDIMDNYLFAYYDPIALHLQSLGLVGFIDCYYAPSHYLFYTIRGVDKATGTVSADLYWGLDEAKYNKEFIGQRIQIFGGLMTCENWETMNEEYLAAIENNKTFMVSLTDTPNPLEGYIHPVSPLYYIHRTMVAASVILVAVSTVDNIRVGNVYRRSSVKKGFNYSVTSLVLAFLGNAFRFVVVLDPESMMGITTLEQSIIAASLSDSFHVFSSLSSMVVWFDLIVGTLASIELKYRAFTLTQMTSVRVIVFLGMLVAGLLDLALSYGR
jgi:hypothetical protein